MPLDRASNEAELEGGKIKSHSITFDWRLNEVLFAHNTVTDPASNSRKCGEILKQQIKMRQSLLMQETRNKRNDDAEEIGWLLYCFWSFTPDVRMVRVRRVWVCALTRVTAAEREDDLSASAPTLYHRLTDQTVMLIALQLWRYWVGCFFFFFF